MPSAPEPVAPSQEESRLADHAARRLGTGRSGGRMMVSVENDGHETVEIPAVAAQLLLRLLKDLAQGHAVTLIPVHAVLTTQEAADLLGVSRPFVIKLLQNNTLPYQMVGSHRRIKFEDLMAYKRAKDDSREQALRDMAADAQEHGLGY